MGRQNDERDVFKAEPSGATSQQLQRTFPPQISMQARQIDLLADAFSRLGEGVMITDETQNPPGPIVLFANEALCRMTGYSNDELVGRSPRLLQGERTSRETLERLKRELSAGHECRVELVNYRKDGTPFDVELFITPIFDGLGRITNFVSINRDVSERNRALAQLRNSEERMQAILKTAADAIITLDRHGLITDANPATERMFGYAQAELMGHDITMLMPRPFCEEQDGFLFRLLKSCEAPLTGCSRETLGLRKDGSTFAIDLTVSQVDHMRLFTAIIRDISQRRTLQKRVLDIADDERRRIGQDLHDGTGQELTGLSLFAGTLVELLTKLPQAADGHANWIFGEADMRLLRDTAERLSSGLTKAQRNVQQLARGILPVQIEPGGLSSALDELARTTNALRHIRCRFNCPVPIDVSNNNIATHLYRIAQEAVSNALRYSQCREICISLSASEGEVILQVSDDGTGFDTDRTSRSAATDPNHGFGLEIMRYRAGIIGGAFQLARRKEGGTLVKCSVPTGNR